MCPTYEFFCKQCGSFDVIKPSSGNLREHKCNECGKLGKRVYTVVPHKWSGMQSPTHELDTAMRRVERNKRIYGPDKADAMERENKQRTSQRVIDPLS